MTDVVPVSETVSIITALTPLVAAVGSLISVIVGIWVAIRQKKAEEKIDIVTAKTEQVHLATNSMKDELVRVTRKDALAEGKLVGHAEAIEIAGAVEAKKETIQQGITP